MLATAAYLFRVIWFSTGNFFSSLSETHYTCFLLILPAISILLCAKRKYFSVGEFFHFPPFHFLNAFLRIFMERLGGESIYIYFLSTEFRLMEIQWLFLLPFLPAYCEVEWEKKEQNWFFDKLTLDSINELECLTRFDVEKGRKCQVNN